MLYHPTSIHTARKHTEINQVQIKENIFTLVTYQHNGWFSPQSFIRYKTTPVEILLSSTIRLIFTSGIRQSSEINTVEYMVNIWSVSVTRTVVGPWPHKSTLLFRTWSKKQIRSTTEDWVISGSKKGLSGRSRLKTSKLHLCLKKKLNYFNLLGRC